MSMSLQSPPRRNDVRWAIDKSRTFRKSLYMVLTNGADISGPSNLIRKRKVRDFQWQMSHKELQTAPSLKHIEVGMVVTFYCIVQCL
jgi:hypothetical protein